MQFICLGFISLNVFHGLYAHNQRHAFSIIENDIENERALENERASSSLKTGFASVSKETAAVCNFFSRFRFLNVLHKIYTLSTFMFSTVAKEWDLIFFMPLRHSHT
jgi:hypothetical protein